MIDIFYLTGEFIEKNCNISNWSEFLTSQGIVETAILKRRAFLTREHFSLSTDLLQQDFEIRSSDNSDYALAIDAVCEAVNGTGNETRFFVIPAGQMDIRPLLRQLHDRVKVIVLSNQDAPSDVGTLCQSWINLSQTEISATPSVVSNDDTLTNPETKPTVELLEPNEAFWKDKIYKSLSAYIEAQNGIANVSAVVQWLYALQFNVGLSEIKQEQVSADVRGRAILKQYLPAPYIWEEIPGLPARIKDSSKKENQTVSAAEAIEQLQLGSKTSQTPAPSVLESNPSFLPYFTPTDINHVIIGADLLQQHCQWVVEREEMLRQKADYQTEIQPRNAEFIAMGKEKGVLIWTITSPLPSSEAYLELSKCYSTLKDAFRFLKQVLESRPEGYEGKNLLQQAAQMAANAQCILKTELRSLGKEAAKDPIQNEAFRLLREVGSKERCFLQNIKSQDELPLSDTQAVLDEISSLQEQFYSHNTESKQKKNLIGKLDYHVKQLKNGTNPSEQWGRIIAAATELSTDYNMPPSDIFFRQQLESMLDQIPDDVEITDEFGRIIQEIELHLARVREMEELEAFGSLLPENVLTPAVEKVREMYGGTTMVFIGGEPKEHISRRLEERFNIKLIWNSTNHSESLNRFDGELSDPDVSLFLIYIPWCSHKHSEELSQIVQRAGKKFVRLRKGTNPDVIAEAICAQTDRMAE